MFWQQLSLSIEGPREENRRIKLESYNIKFQIYVVKLNITICFSRDYYFHGSQAKLSLSGCSNEGFLKKESQEIQHLKLNGRRMTQIFIQSRPAVVFKRRTGCSINQTTSVYAFP